MSSCTFPTIIILFLVILDHHFAQAGRRWQNSTTSGKCTKSRPRDDEASRGCGIGKYFTGSRLRIHQGENTREGEFPFVVSIVKNDDRDEKCAGVLIHEEVVLTSAGCIEPNQIYKVGVGDFDVRPGVHDETFRNVYKIWVPTSYHGDTGDEIIANDIAFLWIERIEIHTGGPPYVATACLAKAGEVVAPPYCALGWGHDESGYMQSQLKKKMIERLPLHDLGGNLKCQLIVHTKRQTFDYGDTGGPLIGWVGGRAYLMGIMASRPVVRSELYNCFVMYDDVRRWVDHGIHMVTYERKNPSSSEFKRIPIENEGNPHIPLT